MKTTLYLLPKHSHLHFIALFVNYSSISRLYSFGWHFYPKWPLPHQLQLCPHLFLFLFPRCMALTAFHGLVGCLCQHASTMTIIYSQVDYRGHRECHGCMLEHISADSSGRLLASAEGLTHFNFANPLLFDVAFWCRHQACHAKPSVWAFTVMQQHFEDLTLPESF